jgi:hypothetical protein
MYTSTTTTSPSLYSVRQGWQCPLCLLVYSPDVESCACDQKDYISDQLDVDWTQPEEPFQTFSEPPVTHWVGSALGTANVSLGDDRVRRTACTVAGCTSCNRR